MVGSIETMNVHQNGWSIHNGNGLEEKLDELRSLLGKADGDPLRIVGVGAGAWGSVFAALLQDSYGQFRDKVQIRIWRRPGRAVDRATAEHLFEVINSREDVLRRLIRRCAYLKYVEARLGDRTLFADEILKDGFCLNMIDTPLCPLKVVTNLQEAVWDADIVVNGVPSTETSEVFEEISHYWMERITMPIIISLAKGIEAALQPVPHIITPTQMINRARMVAALTNESATSKSVYFAHCTSEMIFITHLLAEEPEKLAGPLLADTYVTLLKGRNAWYGQMLAKGELNRDMGDSISGKGMIQGVSAVKAFYELLSQPSLSVLHPDGKKPVAPVELCPILKTLYKILISREHSSQAILQALRDETLNDPRERIEIAQSHAFYRPSLLGQP
ncbi:glycerol-3-phosphate dehydrogenase [NAD(+)] GPDHC1, cytosolic isoform X2 [Manihot esculenta]|uniref:glycerol-3-phosphate dehydrogenase [NAD(+)] GPDHC1, cytosolic isoform X2 n=1 Tax=Manihot esculenta TaxID=3983 RepID=UPI001CC3BBC4|nr:glycerol-3-phosphate dehydrogenase [NAD(+)] GPDHC1, cytosolic isoform X2 [Manihot esculenta]